jgi:hypothetical protein
MPARTPDSTAIKRRRRRKRTGTPILLGGGPFTDPANPWSPVSTREARARFLKALNEVAPEALTALYEGPFQAFRSLSYIPSPQHEGVLTWQVIVDASTEDESANALRASLENWAGPRNVSVPWVYDSALFLLTLWWLDDTTPSEDNWLDVRVPRAPWGWPSERRKVLGYSPPFTFSHAGWDPTRLPRGRFSQKVIRDFRAQLNRYLSTVDKIAAGVLEPSPRIPDPEHFVWTVQFQVVGLSFLDIAKQSDVVPHDILDKTVSTAVRKVLHLIDLPQRKTRLGRTPTRQRASK